MEIAVDKEPSCRLDSGSYPACHDFSFPSTDYVDTSSAEVLLTCHLGPCKHIAWLCSKHYLVDLLDLLDSFLGFIYTPLEE